MGDQTRDGTRGQTLTPAFVVNPMALPMDAQKSWQVTLGLLRCLWAIGQRFRASEAAKQKLAK